MSSRDAESANFTRLLDRSMAVITSYFSSFVLLRIVSRPARAEITVIVFVLLAIWFMADRFLRRWLKSSVLMKENVRWRAIIVEVLDFLLMFGLFLIAQLVLHGLSSGIGASELDSVEVVVFIFTLILGGFAVVHTVKTLQLRIQ